MRLAHYRWFIFPVMIVGLVLVWSAAAGAASWETLYREGELALLRKDYGGAQKNFGTALRIAERFAVDDPRLGKTLNSLAAVYYAQGDFEHAVPLLRRSLAVMELALGPDDPDVAQSMKNLAAVYYLQRNYADAEPLFRRALKIWENALGPEHPYVATLLSHMAGLYQAQGRYDDARPLLVRSLGIWETLLGPEHPNVVQSRRLLAELGVTDDTAKPTAPVQVATAAAADVPAEAASDGATTRLILTEPSAAATADGGSGADTTTPAEAVQPAPAATIPLTGAGATKSKALGRSRGVTQSAEETVVAAAAPVLAVRKAAKRAAEAAAEPAQQAALPSGEDAIAVFLASFRSPEEAERDWARLQQRFPDLLGERTLEVETATLNSNGTFFRILTGPFADRDAARQVCRQLKAARQFCRVVRR